MSAPTGSQQVVVLAEDYPDVRELIGDILRGEGYRVVAVSRGDDVVGAVRENRPSVVLLDLALPDEPGSAVLRELGLSEDTAQVPVVVVTAYTERVPRDPRVRMVVSKPFEIDDLVAAVEEAGRPRQTAA